jgi:hypothetical protein
MKKPRYKGGTIFGKELKVLLTTPQQLVEHAELSVAPARKHRSYRAILKFDHIIRHVSSRGRRLEIVDGLGG